jgi:molecular chaperone GrpE (heat shock protein)
MDRDLSPSDVVGGPSSVGTASNVPDNKDELAQHLNVLAEDLRVSENDSAVSKEGSATVEAAPALTPTDLSSVLLGLEARLLEVFERKIAFDAVKEKQIDRLHDELQLYKSDLLQKATRPLLSVLIKLHGDVIRLITGIKQQDPAKLTVERVVDLFESFRDEIEDLLSDQGIHAFRDTADDRFDVRRQSSVGTEETSDEGKVGRIADRIRPGFEQGATLIEKERVKVYVAARPKPTSETSTIVQD